MLVTGVPRSGTTWLARLLATAPGTALAGREPMNPRGRQYALGGTLDAWTRLREPTAGQRRRLRAAYRGLNPWVYSRYGARQYAAPLPGTRVVVKDPCALLAIGPVAQITGAVPVLVYRHPGAVLASFRRMGWRPRVDEVRELLPGLAPADADPATELASFWAAMHTAALADLDQVPGAVVVSHSELAHSGAAGGERLLDAVGLRASARTAEELTKEGTRVTVAAGRLHDFDRSPQAVAEAWRADLSPEDLDIVERIAGPTLAALDLTRLQLPG
ncbi:hypothetical protein GCM10009623_27470 [Nocardioides aestuarii]